MSRLDRRRLDRLIDDFAGVRLLVVGDLVLDEYVWGDVDRVSPEAPVPVVHVQRETVMLGGAANAARNTRSPLRCLSAPTYRLYALGCRPARVLLP